MSTHVAEIREHGLLYIPVMVEAVWLVLLVVAVVETMKGCNDNKQQVLHAEEPLGHARYKSTKKRSGGHYIRKETGRRV